MKIIGGPRKRNGEKVAKLRRRGKESNKKKK